MKKFLSLALALVMTMSLVVVGAGAKEFTDDSKIAYDEAVAVISEAGIIDGYTDGSFNPTGTLTRGAAAKIICNMILGPTTAGALSADAAPFVDVPANHVFAGYIAYCSQQGIINGYADGTFKPAGTLTGYQFMKMLLGALGYDGKYEGFTGANWSINVAKLALNLGLEDGNDDFVGTKAVTREEACLYAFNTLEADMVEYNDNTQITVGDVVITTASKASKVANTKFDYKGRSNADDGIMQFIEKYFDDLEAKAATDAFGRPATKWENDGEEIGTYADTADAVYVLNESNQKITDVLYDSVKYWQLDASDFAAKVTLAINGDVEKANTDVAVSALSATLKAGDQIEVFEDSNNDYYKVVVVRYTVAKIDSVDDEVSSAAAKKGATYTIELTDLSDAFQTEATTSVLYDAYENDASQVLKGFDPETYVEGAVIVVAANAAGDVLASSLADTATGAVSAYKIGNKPTMTVAGTAYPLTGSAAGKVAADKIDYDDSDYTVYLDPNGYVVGFKGDTIANLKDVYYVTGVVADAGKYTTSYYAQAVALNDGSVTEFKLTDEALVLLMSGVVTSDATANEVSAAESAYSAANKEYGVAPIKALYSFDADGSKYNAKAYAGDKDADLYVLTGALGDDLKSSDSTFKIKGQKVYVEDSSNFLKVKKAGDDIKVTTSTGSAAVAQANASTAIVVATKSGSTYTVEYAVFAGSDLGAAADTSDIVYIKSTSESKNADGWDTTIYHVDGSGNSETVTTKSNYAKLNFYTFTINDDDVYELTTIADTDKEYSLTAQGVKDYKDETGFVMNAYLLGLKSSALTVTSKDYSFNADDVALGDNVIILDHRTADQRDASGYKTEITNATQLSKAIAQDKWYVTANVFFDDEEVVLVAVTGMGLK